VCKVNCDLPILGLQRYAVAVVGCWIAAAYPAFSPRVGALDRCCSLIGRAVTGGGAGDSRTVEWSARAAYNTDSSDRSVHSIAHLFTYAAYRHCYSLYNGTYEGYGMLSQSFVQICLLSSLLRVIVGLLMFE